MASKRWSPGRWFRRIAARGEMAAAEAARRSEPLRTVSAMAVPAHVYAVGDSPVTLDDLMGSIYPESLTATAERAATVAPGVAITTELLTGSPGHLLADERLPISMRRLCRDGIDVTRCGRRAPHRSTGRSAVRRTNGHSDNRENNATD